MMPHVLSLSDGEIAERVLSTDQYKDSSSSDSGITSTSEKNLQRPNGENV